MYNHFFLRGFLAVAVALAIVTGAQATVTIDLVTVGNPGNTADTVAFNAGSVSYTYQIGKYEVTAGQYAAFLNAVAWEADPYGLYNTQMVSGWNACNIQRNEIPNPYDDFGPNIFEYTVADPDRPVNFVTFWSTIRFANWLHNGQGDGDTETGSYTVGSVNSEVVRNPGATFVVASNDEWHKAAYYSPATDSYFKYATSSDVQPTNVLPDLGNNANVWDGTTSRNTLAVGSYENSASPYGTFDQCGNVREWTDGMNWTDGRIIRDGPTNFWATLNSTLLQFYPESTTADNQGLGFRMVLLSAATPPRDVPGDANNDGFVNDVDAKIMAAHWGATERFGDLTWRQMGDFDGDNFIGPKDAAILAANWGYSSVAEATAAAVPEPSAIMLLLLGFVTTILARRSR